MNSSVRQTSATRNELPSFAHETAECSAQKLHVSIDTHTLGELRLSVLNLYVVEDVVRCGEDIFSQMSMRVYSFHELPAQRLLFYKVHSSDSS